MGKKMMTGMIVLAFICSSFLLMTSCAKKQIQVSEPVQPATQEVRSTLLEGTSETALSVVTLLVIMVARFVSMVTLLSPTALYGTMKLQRATKYMQGLSNLLFQIVLLKVGIPGYIYRTRTKIL